MLRIAWLRHEDRTTHRTEKTTLPPAHRTVTATRTLPIQQTRCVEFVPTGLTGCKHPRTTLFTAYWAHIYLINNNQIVSQCDGVYTYIYHTRRIDTYC